jgi:hypothetical protein
MMWRCPECGTDVEGSFDVCWRCGTTRNGTRDPEFRTADDPEAIPETPRERPQFTIGSILLLTLVLSLLFAAIRDCVISGMAGQLDRAFVGFALAVVLVVVLLFGAGTWIVYALAALIRRRR